MAEKRRLRAEMEAQANQAREEIKAARLAQKKAADAAAEKSRLAVEKLA